MILTIPVQEDGQIENHFGRAPRMAVAKVEADQITDWQVHEVNWDVLHDQGEHGQHHARIVRFLREHEVERVVFTHVGAPMINTMSKMGLTLVQVDPGDAKEAVVAAAAAS